MCTFRSIASVLLLLTACSPAPQPEPAGESASFEPAVPEVPYEELQPVFFDHVRVVDPHPCVEAASFDPVRGEAVLVLGCPAPEMDLEVGDIAVNGPGWAIAARGWVVARG